MAKVDTLPEILRPLMEGSSVVLDRCAVCGRTWPLNQHHIVRRGAGNLYRHGVAVPKPTVTLCGSGNAGGCHGLAHQNRLHFRWVRSMQPVRAGAFPERERGGHWEYILLPEPTKYQKALDMDGWKPLGGIGKEQE